MESSVFINGHKFTVRQIYERNIDDEVQLCVDDKTIERYECKDKQEADITFNTIRDTLAHVSIHAVSK